LLINFVVYTQPSLIVKFINYIYCMNKHTKKLFIAIFYGDLPYIQNLVVQTNTDLYYILPDMYVESQLQQQLPVKNCIYSKLRIL